ncbi:MAG: M23 family metallopeptidase, partial [Spirochaetaceae bacterium]|nr:M23 family metallopeptidase [Spirochaetaceae bacterium]
VASKQFDISKEICYIIGGDEFYFLKGERLSQTERAFFLDSSFVSPLPHGVLTSKFGSRVSPISGKEHFHGGVDLAAPSGTPVLAAKGGTVSVVGYNDVFGNYIILRHLDSMESIYGHLLSADVTKGTVVNRGQVIGKVGSTGASTGPHLHFEIRANGKAQDVNNMFISK